MFMRLLCLFVHLTGGINVRTGWSALTLALSPQERE